MNIEQRIAGLEQAIVLWCDTNTHEIVNNESYSIIKQTELTCQVMHLT